ncbi:hypothetical protein AB0F11_27170 [Streptomyces sp. NPDC032472]
MISRDRTLRGRRVPARYGVDEVTRRLMNMARDVSQLSIRAA